MRNDCFWRRRWTKNFFRHQFQERSCRQGRCRKFFKFLQKGRRWSSCLPPCSGCTGYLVGRFVGSLRKNYFTEKRKNPRNHCGFKDFSGAAGQIRTADLVITNDALYRLSYSSRLSFSRALRYYSIKSGFVKCCFHFFRRAVFRGKCRLPCGVREIGANVHNSFSPRS